MNVDVANAAIGSLPQCRQRETLIVAPDGSCFRPNRRSREPLVVQLGSRAADQNGARSAEKVSAGGACSAGARRLTVMPSVLSLSRERDRPVVAPDAASASNASGALMTALVLVHSTSSAPACAACLHCWWSARAAVSLSCPIAQTLT